jgi:hypothetical protein
VSPAGLGEPALSVPMGQGRRPDATRSPCSRPSSFQRPKRILHRLCWDR